MALTSFKSISLPVAQASLAAVLRCGQSFRWSILTAIDNPDAVEYRFCLKDRVICLRQSSDTLYYRAAFPDPQPSPATLCEREKETLGWLKDYFQLDIDLVTLYQKWAARDQVFAGLQGRFEGIRILRQDPWENLVSFICSSNNNISRITKMVQNLCAHYSPPLLSLPHPFNPTEILTYHPFPQPSALATFSVAQHLRFLGFGYRADYIQRTAQMLVEAHGPRLVSSSSEASELWLRNLRQWSTADARQELLKFIGVGRKVADCVLLMSLDKKEVVPVDTHVYQIAVKHYGMKGTSGKATMSPKLYEAVNAKFFSMWGDYAGWAHTVLFTADLKSFASYGLLTPLPSPPPPSPHKATLNLAGDTTTPATPVLPSSKRRRDPQTGDPSQLDRESTEPSSLADRVKRRRKPAATVISRPPAPFHADVREPKGGTS